MRKIREANWGLRSTNLDRSVLIWEGSGAISVPTAKWSNDPVFVPERRVANMLPSCLEFCEVQELLDHALAYYSIGFINHFYILI